MVLTSSVESELGAPAPSFSLPDARGKIVSLSDFEHLEGLIVVFWCNHCPFVKHIKSEFTAFAREYQAKGLGIVAINSNDFAAYPQDAPDKMLEDIGAFGYTFDYLLDETQAVARAYHAACTPDFFLFDSEFKLAYHGQFDAARPRNDVRVDGRDLRNAADAALSGHGVNKIQTPSIGCNIKWRE